MISELIINLYRLSVWFYRLEIDVHRLLINGSKYGCMFVIEFDDSTTKSIVKSSTQSLTLYP